MREGLRSGGAPRRCACRSGQQFRCRDPVRKGSGDAWMVVDVRIIMIKKSIDMVVQ